MKSLIVQMLVAVLRNQLEMMDWMHSQSNDMRGTRVHRKPLEHRMQVTNLLTEQADKDL